MGLKTEYEAIYVKLYRQNDIGIINEPAMIELPNRMYFN